MIESSQTIREDLKVWEKEYAGKDLKIGYGGLTLMLLVLRTNISILERLENTSLPSKGRCRTCGVIIHSDHYFCEQHEP